MTYLSLSKNNSDDSASSNWANNGLKASIMIYLSLMLVIILALVCTLIESGRVSAMSARLRSITYMAADSVFSEFAQPMFDRFGVMGLWADEQEYLEKFNDYIGKNLDTAGTGVKADMELYGMRFTGSGMEDVTYLTDQEARPFADQVRDYMQIHAAEGLAEEILARTGALEQTAKARDALEKVSEYADEFAKAGQAVADINDKAQRIKDLAENPKTLFEEMGDALDAYERGDESQAQVFAEKKGALLQSRNEISQELAQMKTATDQYYQEAEKARESAGSMSSRIEVREEDYDPELYQALTGRIREVEDAAMQGGATDQQIRDGAAAAEEYRGKLNALDQYFTETQGALSPDNLAYYQTLTDWYKNDLNSVNTERFGGNAEPAPSIEGNADFLVTVNNTYRTGLLDFLAGEVSGKQIDQTSFPSKTVSGKKEEAEDGEAEKMNFADATLEKALFSEYIAKHFGCFTEPKEGSALDYEAEYILGGKASDRDNLSFAVTMLVLLRMGVCLVGLMTDGTKTAEIQELAMAVIGWTGQLYLIKIAENVIMLGWALAEAMIEVKTLLAGRHVPILKGQGDWYLSLEGLQNFSAEEGIGEDKPGGIGYADYLRILLLLQGRNKQLFRTLDMIQADMCVAEGVDFRIKDCITETKAEVSFTAPNVFTGIPAFTRTMGFGGGGYQFRFSQEYAY